ncbi:MAG: cobalamin-dependent protein [Prolixibacteraceae bacterium]|nr:cobalamin-dependent protein [Prolixibacteraceae bacterium]
MMNSRNKTYADAFLEALLNGNRDSCSALAHRYLDEHPSLTDLYEHVISKALYEVGRLWEINKITVATEHLATAIIEGILNELFEKLTAQKKFTKKVVLACVENETHQIGIKMVADVFEMKGWDSYFPGTGLTNSQLIDYMTKTKPDVIAISLSIYFNFHQLILLVTSVREHFPAIEILVGGQAFKQLSSETIQTLGKVLYISDLYILEKFIDTINKQLEQTA